MISIDGAFGEGGGQVLRTALALSLVTGTPFRIDRIRAGRPKPGLLRQHLTAVQAAMAVGNAQVEGATIGSQALTFVPGQVTSGAYTFSVGTAGSTTLVLQTVLPALVLASAPSTLTLEGGTHNPFAPPFDFLAHAFLPLLRRMGPGVTAVLDRPGFYPAGGGKCRVLVTPTPRLQRLDVVDRGEIRTRQARATVASLARSIAERELAVIGTKLGWPAEWLQVVSVNNSRGPGNVVTITVESTQVTEVFTGFGTRGVAAEVVATHAVQAAQQYLATEAAAGVYLADQLLIPMALAGGGSFTTLPLSQHTTTNMHVIAQFLPVHITAEPCAKRGGWLVTVRS
jgi:RNA 3'-terminal phosphate cyclase (ATP)